MCVVYAVIEIETFF